jgi:hypothetical protein
VDVEDRLSERARAGDLDGLMALLDLADPGMLAYKWLQVASDFGHDEADDLIDAVLESLLHTDDDDFVTGQAHFELGVAYLTGGHGLPVDHSRGREHLTEMVRRRYPDHVEGGDAMLAEARSKMAPEAQRVFDAALLLREHDNEHTGRYRNVSDDEE